MKKITLLFLYLFFILLFIQISPCDEVRTIDGQAVISVNNLLKMRKDIQYIKLRNSFDLRFEQIPFAQNESQLKVDPVDFLISFPETFVLSIPYGRVHSLEGFIIVDGMYVDELIWRPMKQGRFHSLLPLSKLEKPEVLHSKVAVITQGGVKNYYHWMVEVLPRLELLQKSGIAYDYIYLPLSSSFMKETVNLLGIDVSKIIQPLHKKYYIEVDELIVPSMAATFGYNSQSVINFLRETFIPLVHTSNNNFAKRVFISRQGSIFRKIINEDEIYALFQQYGFVRYDLEKLSVLDQIVLFHNAEFIVGEHGAGLTNIMFAQPGTQVVEIFQRRQRPMYWHLSQQLNLKYIGVKTIQFDERISSNSCVIIPLGPIEDVIAQLFN